MRRATLLLMLLSATSWAAVDQGGDHGGDIGRRGNAVLDSLLGLALGSLLASAAAAVLGRDSRRWGNVGAIAGAVIAGILAF